MGRAQLALQGRDVTLVAVLRFTVDGVSVLKDSFLFLVALQLLLQFRDLLQIRNKGYIQLEQYMNKQNRNKGYIQLEQYMNKQNRNKGFIYSWSST